MRHDRVLLSYEEKVALAELTAAMPADDWWLVWQLRSVDDDDWSAAPPGDTPGATGASGGATPRAEADDAGRRGPVGPLPLALIGVLALISGGLLTAFSTGVAAWVGMFIWIAGTVVTLWAVATAEARSPAVAENLSGLYR